MADSRILPGHDPATIAQAATALAQGALVGLPTETVYGLAADADNPTAVAQVFARKGRPVDHPLIVHVADAAAAHRYAAALPDAAQRLMAACWPGPVTVVVPRQPGAAQAAAGGQASVGLRCPAHPVAQALLRACAQRGVHGLAAPSANAFGRISPTRALHVRHEFPRDLLILDGGDCAVGIESTLIDCTRGQPVLLRPGQWGVERIEAASGVAVLRPDQVQPSQPAPRASGTLASHYAPRARLVLLSHIASEPNSTINSLLQKMKQTSDRRVGLWLPAASLSAVAALPQPLPAHWVLREQPGQPEAVAHSLFATLRELDDAGCDEVWVAQPPDTPDWAGVRDRLQRAAA